MNSLVGFVNILNRQDGEVAIIPEVPQGNPLTGCQAKLLDFGLGQVKGDGHGEQEAIGETVLLYDTAARTCQTILLFFFFFGDIIRQRIASPSRS